MALVVATKDKCKINWLTAIVMVTESPNNDRFLEEVIDRTAAALLTASVAVPVTVL